MTNQIILRAIEAANLRAIRAYRAWVEAGWPSQGPEADRASKEINRHARLVSKAWDRGIQVTGP